MQNGNKNTTSISQPTQRHPILETDIQLVSKILLRSIFDIENIQI